MAQVSLEHIHEDLEFLKKEVAELRAVVAEEFELSEWAKKRIADYRKAPKEAFVSQEDVEKELLSQ